MSTDASEKPQVQGELAPARRPLPPPGGAHPNLSARLAEPVAWLDFSRLTRHWRHVVVSVEATRPRLLDDGPGLAGRIRGAWGWALTDLARLREGELGPSAYDVFFREQAFWAPRMTVPKPFVLAAGCSGGRLCVRLTLFGFAGFWALEAMQGLVAALRQGIVLDHQARVRAPVEPEMVTVERFEGIGTVPIVDHVGLQFETPYAIESRHGLLSSGPSVLATLANRVSGLARWQDLGIDDAFGRLREAMETLDYDLTGLRPVTWERRSSSDPRRPIPMRGLVGTVAISGDLGPLAPLLSLAPSCHIGTNITLGCGRVRLSALPSD